LLISPDGVIIPLSSRVFFIGFSFSSMVPVVPSFFYKIVPCKVPGLTHDL
jgi:VIT1/CCC1 family predicted Fe2+/Mn2+ transporter